MRRRLWVVVFSAMLTFVAGCARADVSTEVRPDGSWQRTVSLTASAAAADGESMGPKVPEVFATPSGSGWAVTQQTHGDQTTVQAVRTLASGESTQHDVVVLGSKTQGSTAVLDNEAVVCPLDGGRWEYVETLHWKGKPGEGFGADNDIFANVRAAIPAAAASDEAVRQWSHDMTVDMWHLVMGPPDPLLGQMLTHPGLVEQRMRHDMAASMQHMLDTQPGSQLTAAQRTDIVRHALAAAIDKVDAARDQMKHQGDAGGKKDNATLTTLTFTVKVPGQLLETNGLRDDINGTVTWGLFAESPAVADVTLRAVWKP